ncbi:ejaculatory bulb-specific protein 3-like [Bombus pascuorum]|uniref:ejaculatory bulb-specific protein 3-like n=1 Tax=Bombus pascuorum TaxID=65598 RepID=UPI002144CC7B|nr:ejaculatory bulb-specific protein 3-like [Bombus pascuorum]
MKVKILLLFAIFTLTSFIKAQDTTSTMDKLYVQKQINCVLSLRQCDSIGRKIIALLPEALNNHCERCTPQQAALARKLTVFMQQNYPNEWKLIIRRYKLLRYFT